MDSRLETRKLRVFLALPLAVLFEVEVAPLIESLKKRYPDVRWVKPSQIHITLHFFGSIDLKQVAEISKNIAPFTTEIKPFDIFLKGVGGFPNTRRPRVIWVGVQGNVEPLIDLREVIENHLGKAGFLGEERSFKPHLTIGRVKWVEQPMDLNQVSFGPTPARAAKEIVLFQSHLTPQGPHYESIETYPFSSA